MMARGETNLPQERTTAPFGRLLRRFCAAEVTVRGHRFILTPFACTASGARRVPSSY